MSRVAKLTLGLVFPLHCLGCHREGALICAECVGNLKRLERPFCDKCAQPNAGPICAGCLERPLVVDTIRTPFLFDGPVREAVHRLKYRGNGPPSLNWPTRWRRARLAMLVPSM